MKDEATREVLVKARELVDKGWTKRAWARDERYRSVPIKSKRACRFCIAGAIQRVAGGFANAHPSMSAFRGAGISGMTVSNFNDAPSTTKADVLAAFDKAIAYVSEQ